MNQPVHDLAVSPPEYVHSVTLVAGMWQQSEAYDKILNWVNDRDGCQIDFSSRWSIINGNIFYTSVDFIDIEDKLAFALTFCEFVV